MACLYEERLHKEAGDVTRGFISLTRLLCKMLMAWRCLPCHSMFVGESTCSLVHQRRNGLPISDVITEDATRLVTKAISMAHEQSWGSQTPMIASGPLDAPKTRPAPCIS
ncbi:hypothetical protein ABW21_db0208408 [Orbilia brochopaga]|nr:hypothetical protein ABW21_db0208408 [Drechslerella brochopaga]